MPIVSDTTCAAASSDSVVVSDGDGGCKTISDNYGGRISDEMVSAGAPGRDVCSGDSGGPLTVKSAAKLVGVVSWGVSFGAVSILCPVSCILYPVSCILYYASCILYPVSCILYPVSCILYPVSCILYPDPISCFLYRVCILNPVLCIMHTESCILYPLSCIL